MAAANREGTAQNPASTNSSLKLKDDSYGATTALRSSIGAWSDGQTSSALNDSAPPKQWETGTLQSGGGAMDALCTGKSSAVRRHFAQFARHQLQEVNDEIEVGWICGICLETAEDPCVTRCGHLYCRSHLNHWLSKHPSCPVCKSLCTPAQDIVPIFSREQSSPAWTTLSSSCPSPCLKPSHNSRSPSPERSFESTATVIHQPWRNRSSSPTRSQVHGHPQPDPLVNYTFAYYLGITLRVLGLALLLSVLLPGGYFANSPSPSHQIS